MSPQTSRCGRWAQSIATPRSPARCHDRGVKSLARLAFSALVAGVSIVAFAPEAHALGPVDIEVGGRVGVGTKPDSRTASPFGFGLGARGGVSIFHFYGGVGVMHYFGSSTELPTAGGTVNSQYSSTLLGVELGYSITIIPKLLLRPQLGIGNASLSFGNDHSHDHLYLEPGLTALILLDNLYLGADANLLAVTGVPTGDAGGNETKTYAALTAHAQVGIRF